MSYLNSFRVNGNNYQLRDEEALHDGSVFATKQDLGGYALKSEVSNVNCFIDGSTLVFELDGNGGGSGSESEVIMAEFAVSSITTNDQSNTVVALEGLTNLYNDEQKRQELQSNTFSFKWVNNSGSNLGQNGRFQLANSATEEFPAGPGNEKMVINWNAGTLTFINTGFPREAVKVVLIKYTNSGNNDHPNFTDVYTTNITNVSRPDSTCYVYTVEDAGFANLEPIFNSYDTNGWNGAFRTADGIQNGFGSFPLYKVEGEGYNGYKATVGPSILLKFNADDNTITYYRDREDSTLANAATFTLQRVAN